MNYYKLSYAKHKGSGSKANQEKYAIFSSASYQKDKRAYLDKYKMKSWVVDKSLSKPYATVFHNPKTDEVVLAIRGTTSWNPLNKSGDFWANVGLLTGNPLFTSRQRKLEKLNKKVIKKYHKTPIYTGHSQAGYNAGRLAKKNKGDAYIYNAASPPKFDPVDDFLKANHLEAYTTNKLSKGKVDIVSLLGRDKDTTKVNTKTKDTHSIDNFLPDEKTYEGEGKKSYSYFMYNRNTYEQRKG